MSHQLSSQHQLLCYYLTYQNMPIKLLSKCEACRHKRLYTSTIQVFIEPLNQYAASRMYVCRGCARKAKKLIK